MSIIYNKKNILLPSIFIMGVLLSGCESTLVKSEESIAKHPEWDGQTTAYIREGMLLTGMTKDQVSAAWGKHCKTCPGTKKFKWGETWAYPTQIVFFDLSGKMTKYVTK
ncbi:MAG: hypothetical protein QM479_00015 [Pseudomonadota bacterium]